MKKDRENISLSEERQFKALAVSYAQLSEDRLAALLEVGAIDRKTMRLFDASCLTPPNMTAKDVKRIRAKLRVSQEVLAKSIGATKSTIAKWESGINTPSAMAQQLLRVIDRHSLNILD